MTDFCCMILWKILIEILSWSWSRFPVGIRQKCMLYCLPTHPKGPKRPSILIINWSKLFLLFSWTSKWKLSKWKSFALNFRFLELNDWESGVYESVLVKVHIWWEFQQCTAGFPCTYCHALFSAERNLNPTLPNSNVLLWDPLKQKYQSVVWYVECPDMKYELHTLSNDQDIDGSCSSSKFLMQHFLDPHWTVHPEYASFSCR